MFPWSGSSDIVQGYSSTNMRDTSTFWMKGGHRNAKAGPFRLEIIIIEIRID